MELQERLTELENALKVAQDELTQWVRANQELNQTVTEERAKLQGYGNGLVGVFLGSKYRATMRRTTIIVRANIAQEVSQRKAVILDNKQRLQTSIKLLKNEIKEIKDQLKKQNLSDNKNKSAGNKVTTVDQLAQLSKMYKDGLLSEIEFSIAKRRILIEENLQNSNE
jgi:Na+/phosphate symporter